LKPFKKSSVIRYKTNNMKNFKLILEDKEGNELQTINITAENKKEAKKQADILKATTRLNDLYKIIIKN